VATPEGRVVAALIASAGIDLMDLAVEPEALHRKKNTFPGEFLLELATDALNAVGGVS